MKKILFIGAAFLMMSLSSYGATLTLSCGTNLYGPGGAILLGNATISCPNFNIAGQQVTTIGLEYGVDYTYSNPNDSPALSVTINFDPAGSGLYTNDTLNVTRSGFGSNKDPLSAPNTGSQNFAPALISPVVGPSVLLTPGAQSGGYEGFSASVFVTYTYETVPVVEGEVPEPTTVALIGAGLLGVAAAARRRR
jgi:hypothetical protein